MATISSIIATNGAPIAAMNASRTLQVTGTGFAAGMAVQITPPGRPVITVPPSQVQLQSSTSLLLTYLLDAQGSWLVEAAGPAYTLAVRPAPVPAVNGVGPAPLTAVSGQRTFFVQGAGFQQGMTCTYSLPSGPSRTATITASSVTPTAFTAVGTLDAPGGYTVTVNNQVGGLSTPFAFQVAPPPAPQITGSSPLAASTFPQPLRVDGTNFFAGTSIVPATLVVTPQGGSPQRFPLLGASTMTTLNVSAVVPTPGTCQLQVMNAFGTPSNVFDVAVQPAAPTVITGVSPAEPGAGAASQPLTVTGTGFQTGMTATLTPAGGTPVSGVVRNASLTRCEVLAVLDTIGGYGIQLLPPGLPASSVFDFQVQASPVIGAVSPASLVQNAAAQRLQVSGTGFRGGLSVVLVAPNRVVSRLAPGAITNLTGTGFDLAVTLPASGQYQIQATNPGGAVGNRFGFTVLPTPQVTGVTPPSPLTSGAPQQVQVSGTDFLPGLTATVTGPENQPVPGQVQGPTSTAFTLAALLLDRPGAYQLEVANPDGGRSNTWTLEVAPAVEITRIAPGTPRADSNPQTVTVDGTGFGAAVTVVVTGPNGTVPATASLRRPGRLDMEVVLAVPGSYTLQVNDAATGWSSPFPFTVS